jgi:hypothetical protein
MAAVQKDGAMTDSQLICSKTLSFLGLSAGSQIDFGHFAPMFRLNAASDRNAIPWFAARLRKSEPPASLKRAVSGQNATAFLPSIPNGGID